ncbi:hypothetical protein ACOMHN_018261 [Nucella lapillus]
MPGKVVVGSEAVCSSQSPCVEMKEGRVGVANARSRLTEEIPSGGDDQVFLPSSNSWGRWSSADLELDTTVWHLSARRWVLVPPTIPVFADSPPLSHPPREATYPRFITDYSESDEDLFRSSPYSITEPGPSRASSRTQSLHCQDSGSCRVSSPLDFLEDEATPGSAVTAGALLEPVLPHFVTAAQPNEKADDEVLLLTIAPSEALWEMRVFSIAPRGCGKTDADGGTALTPLGPPVRWVHS